MRWDETRWDGRGDKERWAIIITLSDKQRTWRRPSRGEHFEPYSGEAGSVWFSWLAGGFGSSACSNGGKQEEEGNEQILPPKWEPTLRPRARLTLHIRNLPLAGVSLRRVVDAMNCFLACSNKPSAQNLIGAPLFWFVVVRCYYRCSSVCFAVVTALQFKRARWARKWVKRDTSIGKPPPPPPPMLRSTRMMHCRLYS